jgi:cytochrome c6
MTLYPCKTVALVFLCIPVKTIAAFTVKLDQKPCFQSHGHALLKITTVAATLIAATGTANAADIAAGQKIFDQSCASCHAGGNNAIAKQRTLKQEALNEYLLNPQSGSDIVKFIKDSNVHRGALAFSAKLDDAAYENVGQYVFTQAMQNKW